LVRIAAATATGDEAKLHARMIAARAIDVPPLWVEELLLQSFLNVGYPLALVAFGVMAQCRRSARDTASPSLIPSGAAGRSAAWKACSEVYGRTYHKLLLNLRALHPAIEPLVVVDAYGKILGRPGLDSKRRELCTAGGDRHAERAEAAACTFAGALNTGFQSRRRRCGSLQW